MPPGARARRSVRDGVFATPEPPKEKSRSKRGAKEQPEEIVSVALQDISLHSGEFLDFTVDSYCTTNSDDTVDGRCARKSEYETTYYLSNDLCNITSDVKQQVGFTLPSKIYKGTQPITMTPSLRYLFQFYSHNFPFEYLFEVPATHVDHFQLQSDIRKVFATLPSYGNIQELRFYADVLSSRPAGVVSHIQAKVLELLQVQHLLYCTYKYIHVHLKPSRTYRIPRLDQLSLVYVRDLLKVLYADLVTWNTECRHDADRFLKHDINNNEDEKFKMYIFGLMPDLIRKIFDGLPYLIHHGNGDFCRVFLTDAGDPSRNTMAFFEFCRKYCAKIDGKLGDFTPKHVIRKPVKTKFIELALRLECIEDTLSEMITIEHGDD